MCKNYLSHRLNVFVMGTFADGQWNTCQWNRLDAAFGLSLYTNIYLCTHQKTLLLGELYFIVQKMGE